MKRVSLDPSVDAPSEAVTAMPSPVVSTVSDAASIAISPRFWIKSCPLAAPPCAMRRSTVSPRSFTPQYSTCVCTGGVAFPAIAPKP